MSARRQGRFDLIHRPTGEWHVRIVWGNGAKGWGTQHTYNDVRDALHAIELLPGFQAFHESCGDRGCRLCPAAALFAGRYYAIRRVDEVAP